MEIKQDSLETCQIQSRFIMSQTQLCNISTHDIGDYILNERYFHAIIVTALSECWMNQSQEEEVPWQPCLRKAAPAQLQKAIAIWSY